MGRGINPSEIDIKNARINELTERAAEIPLLRAELAAVKDTAKKEIAKLIASNEALIKHNANVHKQLSDMNSKMIDLKGVIEDKEKDIEALKYQLELANNKKPSIGSAESYRKESLKRGKIIAEQVEKIANLEKTCNDYRDEVYNKGTKITELENKVLLLIAENREKEEIIKKQKEENIMLNDWVNEQKKKYNALCDRIELEEGWNPREEDE